MDMNKTLVAYFSCTGTTRRAAQALAAAVDADVYEIRPQIPYTPADLDWRNKKSRSSVEMNDPDFRPALADKNAAIGAYNTIFVGFPIWWYVAPTIINTFLETYDFSGKRVILFATSGGSGFGETAAALKKSLSPDAALVEGKLLNTGLSPADLRAWRQSLALSYPILPKTAGTEKCDAFRCLLFLFVSENCNFKPLRRLALKHSFPEKFFFHTHTKRMVHRQVVLLDLERFHAWHFDADVAQ